MFNTSLFLGFPLSGDYSEKLEQLSLVEKELFIQNRASPYLQIIENEGVIYLGKDLGSSIETACLDSLYSHIYSLLKKMVPDFPYGQHPLIIFAFST